MIFGLKHDYQFLWREMMMNNKKILIWLDDSSNRMEQIARQTFSELWQVGIFNKTVFFGDYVQKVKGKNLKAYQLIVNDLFYHLCQSKGIISEDNTTPFLELSALYTDYQNNGSLEDIAISLHSEGVPEDVQEKIDALTTSWKQLANTKEIWGKTFKETEEKYDVSCIFETVADVKHFAYALDLILLDGDEDKLNCAEEKSVPIISMELYRYITTNLQAKCVLYSSDTCLNRLTNNWKMLYQKRYGKTQLDIIQRSLLHRGSLDNATLETFKNLF